MKGFVFFNNNGNGLFLRASDIAEVHISTRDNTIIKMSTGDIHTVCGDASDVLDDINNVLSSDYQDSKSEKLNNSDVTANVWIPIENGLPSPMTDVQVAYVHKYPVRKCADFIAYLDADGWVNSYDCTHMDCVVTHWRPIDTDFIPGGTR